MEMACLSPVAAMADLVRSLIHTAELLLIKLGQARGDYITDLKTTVPSPPSQRILVRRLLRTIIHTLMLYLS